MKLRQPKLVDVRERIIEQVTALGTRKIRAHYAHLMFGDDLVRVRVSDATAAWIRGEEKGKT